MPRNVVVVRKWAGSRALVVPRYLTKQLRIAAGGMYYVTAEGDALVFRPLQIPQGVKLNGDGETDAQSARREQPDTGAGVARGACVAHSGDGAGDGAGDTTLV